jgi:hypothetical protein
MHSLKFFCRSRFPWWKTIFFFLSRHSSIFFNGNESMMMMAWHCQVPLPIKKKKTRAFSKNYYYEALDEPIVVCLSTTPRVLLHNSIGRLVRIPCVSEYFEGRRGGGVILFMLLMKEEEEMVLLYDRT